MLRLSFILFQCSLAMFIPEALMVVSDHQIAIMETVRHSMNTAIVTLTEAINESDMRPRYQRREKVTQSFDSGSLQYGVDVLAEVREIVAMIHYVLDMEKRFNILIATELPTCSIEMKAIKKLRFTQATISGHALLPLKSATLSIQVLGAAGQEC